MAPAMLLLGLAGALAFPAAAAGHPAERQKLIDSTVRFLQDAQRPSGGFATPGKKPSQGISAWVALALAAAGINPRDQASCGTDALSFLEANFESGLREELAWPQVATTALERELLVAVAAGADRHEYGGRDLVAEILARQADDGSFPYVPGGRGEINDTAFAILALAPVAEPAAEAAVARAAQWLALQPNESGGWSWAVKGRPENVDLTGAAIEALNAAGDPGSAAQLAALAFLRQMQGPDGGFAEGPPGGESNVASTAWAVQGLWAAGEDPEAWSTGSGRPTEEPLDYMESLQQPDGHVRWKASSDLNGIWMTAYVTPAFAGQALPILAVPRALPEPGAGASGSRPSCAEPGGSRGPGATSSEHVVGVSSGGGGEGAPDFSRPRPQSKGRTAGGARLLGNPSRSPRDHAAGRRGENARQPLGTEYAEPSGSSAATVPAHVGGSGTGGGGGSGLPENGSELAETSASGHSGERGRVVSGALIASLADSGPGRLTFGAPGLRSGTGSSGGGETLALAIALAALLSVLGGSLVERIRGAGPP